MSADAANTIPGMIFLDDWPRIQSKVSSDPETEVFIADIVSRMTLEEKVGQMIQPDLREVTPDEVTEYKLGSILNGGGAFPGNDKYATAADWAETAETFYQASSLAFEVEGFGFLSRGRPTRSTATIMYSARRFSHITLDSAPPVTLN